MHTHAHTWMVGVSAWLPGDSISILPWRSVFVYVCVCVLGRGPLAGPPSRPVGSPLLSVEEGSPYAFAAHAVNACSQVWGGMCV